MNIEVAQFGSRCKFLVKVETHASEESGLILCRLNYVIEDQEVGGDEWFEVEDVLQAARWVRHYAGKRQSKNLYDTPTASLFTQVVSVLYGETEPDERSDDFTEVSRFNLWFHHSLGSAVILLFAWKANGRILFAQGRDEQPRELFCNISNVESSIESAMERLDSLVK